MGSEIAVTDRATDVTSDGFIFDVDTGEVIGMAESAMPSKIDVFGYREPFHVADQDAAEWVLRKLSDAEAEVLALRSRLKALQWNMELSIKAAERKAAWLRNRFEGELAQFASQALTGKRRRTWACPYGTVAFRKVPVNVRVEDMDAAVAWAKANGLGDKVRVREDVLASDCKAAVLDAERGTADGFAIVSEHDSVRISTGIEV